VPAAEFNDAAERYYRDTLRKGHFSEGFRWLVEEWWQRGRTAWPGGPNRDPRQTLAFVRRMQAEVLADRATPDDVRRLIHLVLETIGLRAGEAETWIEEQRPHAAHTAPICRA
jgi:hypothetical protein